MFAEHAQSILQEENIKSVVSGDSGGWAPHLTGHAGGVQLFVIEEEVERATELLKQNLGDE